LAHISRFVINRDTMTTNIMMRLRQWTVSDDDVLRSISDNEADCAVALPLDDM